MDTISLKRTGLPDLSFQGQLIARSEGSDADDVTQGRRHDISVYRADDGQFVVAVAYRSPFSEELSDCFVEAVDTEEEIEAVLSLYDPTERIAPALFDGPDDQKLQKVRTALTERFDRQVLDVLEQIRARRESAAESGESREKASL